ncbi:hypothetical protein PENSPDRAFT_288316 [Peniophora sp. CONT]|nr:hypothetical protein PENSPDRAFT_288316 [Peniophora sp. CONT]
MQEIVYSAGSWWHGRKCRCLGWRILNARARRGSARLRGTLPCFLPPSSHHFFEHRHIQCLRLLQSRINAEAFYGGGSASSDMGAFTDARVGASKSKMYASSSPRNSSGHDVVPQSSQYASPHHLLCTGALSQLSPPLQPSLYPWGWRNAPISQHAD